MAKSVGRESVAVSGLLARTLCCRSLADITAPTATAAMRNASTNISMGERVP